MKPAVRFQSMKERIIEMPRDKQENFRRLAQNRVNMVLEDIRKIENLSNRGNYEYTPEQIDRMFGAIETAITEAKGKFGSGKVRRPFNL